MHCIYLLYPIFNTQQGFAKEIIARIGVGFTMTNQLYSIFDNKKKYYLVSEDELKKFHQYVFDKDSGFDAIEAKNLFDEVGSRQAQNDVRSWQLVCKYCPLYLRCDVAIEDTSKCQIYSKLSVRNYALHALDEIQFQRQRLNEIFSDMKKEGTCDNNCEICLLCNNSGECSADKALRLLRESKTEEQSEVVCMV